MELKTFIGKVRKRLIQIYSKNIPFNSKYRPVGVVSLRAIDKKLMEYVELSPGYRSTLELDPEFISKCSPSLKPVIDVEFPADYFAIIRNGRIYTCNENNMAVILSDNRLVEEASFQWDGDKISPAAQNEIFSRKGLIPPKRIRGNVFSLLSTGATKHFYYHWVFEVLPKLFLLKKSGYLDKIDFFLIPFYGFKYQREYLEYFKIPKHKMINEEYQNHIQADNLMICSFVRKEMHHPKWACDFLFDSFRVPNKKRDKMIYVGRGDASRNRKVHNEPELKAMLETYGFETLLLTNLSVAEQAAKFNAAKIVIGAHGAGLSNLVYCESGTKVLEIFPDNYVRHGFHDVCNKRGLEYHYILCKSDGELQHHSTAQRLGLMADLEAIKTKIDSFVRLEEQVVSGVGVRS